MTDLQKGIGSRIREAREKAKLTQESFAELVNISTSYEGQVERGEKNPSIAILNRMASALDLPLSRLIDTQELRESRNSYGANPKWRQLVKLSEHADDETLDVLLKLLRVLRKKKK